MVFDLQGNGLNSILSFFPTRFAPLVGGFNPFEKY